MNIKEIKEMIALMNENNLQELEIEKEGMRIRLKKTLAQQEGSLTGPIIIEKQTVGSGQQFIGQQEKSSETTAKTIEIRAPMVGTFYRTPSPETEPYVETEQIIEPGQVICIIEAMKLMNEIKSEIKGRVIEILVENAEPVEFGQPLFIVEPQ